MEKLLVWILCNLFELLNFVVEKHYVMIIEVGTPQKRRTCPLSIAEMMLCYPDQITIYLLQYGKLTIVPN